MIDKELNELLEYNQEYMDSRLSEDVFGGDYTSEVELKYLKKDYDKLQSNWNSLREWIKENSWYYNTSDGCQWVDQFKLLDKMNELEGKE